MKRLMAVVLVVLLALSMGTFAFADEAEEINIAFVMHAQNGSFYTKLSDGAEAAAADLGIKVNVSAPNTASSLQDQISLLETAVASDVDGIATVTWDVSGFNGIIAEAAEKGIPVIGFNQDAEGSAHLLISLSLA